MDLHTEGYAAFFTPAIQASASDGDPQLPRITLDLVGFGDAFPGSEAFEEQSLSRCHESFEGFVGVPYEQSELYFMTLEPTEESWAQLDDREIICLLIPESGTFSYDARNSGR